MANKNEKYSTDNYGERRKKPRGRLLLPFLGLLVAIAIIGGTLMLGKNLVSRFLQPPVITQSNQVNKPNEDDSLPAPPTGADRKGLYYTFLIVGLDGGVNTDTIMVASCDGTNKTASVIGIPRDSKVNVKRELKKINAAYATGTLNGGGKEGGIRQLKKEVKTLIGFEPDYYILINFNAFKKIVDAIGGVDIDVAFDMKYDDPTQDLHIDISKGRQLLNGDNALKFARYRKGNNPKATISDYQRIENQQTVIKAVLDKLLKPANILKVPELIGIFTDNVYTDIKPENMLWFADQLRKIKGAEALSTYTMPASGTSGPPMYYEYLDKTAVLELVNKAINPYKKDLVADDLDW